MVILSVDYGDMRTGVAVCDKMEILASPVGVVKGDYAPKVAEEIRKIAIMAIFFTILNFLKLQFLLLYLDV